MNDLSVSSFIVTICRRSNYSSLTLFTFTIDAHTLVHEKQHVGLL